jgi:hypothetical protein
MNLVTLFNFIVPCGFLPILQLEDHEVKVALPRTQVTSNLRDTYFNPTLLQDRL